MYYRSRYVALYGVWSFETLLFLHDLARQDFENLTYFRRRGPVLDGNKLQHIAFISPATAESCSFVTLVGPQGYDQHVELASWPSPAGAVMYDSRCIGGQSGQSKVQMVWNVLLTYSAGPVKR